MTGKEEREALVEAWRQARGAMPSGNFEYTKGLRMAGDRLAAALTALESLSPGAPERHDTPLALHLAARVIADHENLEENAPVDPFCGGCNQGAGPHRAPCAYHAAVNIVARKADPRILDWILPALLTAAPSAPAKEDGHG